MDRPSGNTEPTSAYPSARTTPIMRCPPHMAHELADHGVTVVSLYPGLVRTEAVLAAGVFDLSNSESPEFSGRAVAAPANDPEALRHSGQVLVAAQLGRDYGFKNIDGKSPVPVTIEDV